MSEILNGWGEISKHLNVCERTARKLLKKHNLPVRICDGIAITTASAITAWILERQERRSRSEDIGFIYVLQVNEFYKIGKTNSMEKRLLALSAVNPYDIKVIIAEQVINYHAIEETLHKRYANKRHKFEWFNLENSDIEDIRKILSRGKSIIT